MKISIPVIYDVEVEIDPWEYLDEVWASALAQSPRGEFDQPKFTLNRMAAWLKAMPDDALGLLSPSQRSLLADFFEAQARRCRECEAPTDEGP